MKKTDYSKILRSPDGVVTLLNTIRDGEDDKTGMPYTNDEYRNYVPIATVNNIMDVGNPIINYTPVFNMFLDVLVNKFALEICEQKSWNNPLDIFKKGSISNGQFIQNIGINPAKPQEYTLGSFKYDGTQASADISDSLFSVDKPDLQVEYYRDNRHDKFSYTITREILRQAFQSTNTLGNFISSMISSLYSGDEIEEYNQIKNLINNGFAANPKRIINIPLTVQDLSTQTNVDKVLVQLRSLYSHFLIPSNKYNAWKQVNSTANDRIAWTEPGKICILTTPEIEAAIDVLGLSAAFNMDKADYIGKRVLVDGFTDPSLAMVICDEGYIQLYDNLMEVTQWFSPANLSTKYFLHHWQTYSVSLLANAVALTFAPAP